MQILIISLFYEIVPKRIYKIENNSMNMTMLKNHVKPKFCLVLFGD